MILATKMKVTDQRERQDVCKKISWALRVRKNPWKEIKKGRQKEPGQTAT